MADALKSGAQDLVRLQSDVRALVEAHYRRKDIDAGIENHGFEAIDALVLNSILVSVVNADPMRRQGFVRSLSWLFYAMALECVPDIDETMVDDVLRTLQATAGGAHA